MQFKKYNNSSRAHCKTMCDTYYVEDIMKFSSTKFSDDSHVRELIESYRVNKDAIYLERLTSIFTKFVLSIANNYQHNHLTLSDLISEGMLGLYTAINTFDLTKDTKFITYAYYTIARSIMDALDKNNHIIWLPKNIRVANHSNRSQIKKLKLHKDNYSDVAYDKLYTDLQANIVHTTMVPYDTKLELYETAVFSTEADVTKKLDNISLSKDLKSILNILLTETERNIIIYKFGLFDNIKIKSVNSLAGKLGITIGETIRSYKKAMSILSQERVKDILIKYLDN